MHCSVLFCIRFTFFVDPESLRDGFSNSGKMALPCSTRRTGPGDYLVRERLHGLTSFLPRPLINDASVVFPRLDPGLRIY